MLAKHKTAPQESLTFGLSKPSLAATARRCVVFEKLSSSWIRHLNCVGQFVLPDMIQT
jgi:hypothetical protein